MGSILACPGGAQRERESQHTFWRRYRRRLFGLTQRSSPFPLVNNTLGLAYVAKVALSNRASVFATDESGEEAASG